MTSSSPRDLVDLPFPIPLRDAAAAGFIWHNMVGRGERHACESLILLKMIGGRMNSPDERVLVQRQSPYHYSPDGLELKERADRALIPLFVEFMGRGYSPYQICAVLHDGVAETSRHIISVHKTAGKDAADQMLKEKLKQ